MVSISSLWDTNNEFFRSKKVQQIIAITGEGTLKDGNKTSLEFRDLLSKIPSKLLDEYANECLLDKFLGSGYVLQDIVNQIGSRLGFEIQYGRYRGVKNAIGYDGIWVSKDQYNIVVEVKTTDAYRINLDDITKYRHKYIQQKNFALENSSILIIVGRFDTGDLEDQIIGSRHSRDIRLISVNALINLLYLKENLNDAKTFQQINSILRPMEYTKIDKLVDLITTTAKDLEISQNDLFLKDKSSIDFQSEALIKMNLTFPIDFYDESINRLNSYLNNNLIKQTKASYITSDNSTGIILTLSKSYTMKTGSEKFWFSIYPQHVNFLNELPKSFVAFGCGLNLNIYLINYKLIQEILPYMTTTTKGPTTYWHILIYNRNGNFTLRVPGKKQDIDLSKYKIK
ncbi:MAG: hypothetical protein ACREV6_21445 [Clostridium sp.]|uniref:hypothetical protein n=1 Tax=Clostridium sp. TaxID=1506 RepID=UPI003D6D23E9